MSKTDYSENKVVDLLNGKTAFTLPTVYVALFTAAPSDAGGGTEVTGGAYARKQTAATDWAAAAAGSATNSATITFVTTTAAWGTVTHFATFDAPTAGNMLRWGPVGTSKTVGTGDTASFPANSFTTTED